MRCRSSSKQGRNVRGVGSMKIDNVNRVKEEPHLSGAYIRSLVKQLTSSRTKDSIVEVEGDGVQKNKIRGEIFGDHSQSQEQPKVQPPHHKKQVRRRLHTSRPYQERLLNMAEARREIVTALKFHRASMKQQEAINQDHLSLPVAQPSLAQEPKSKSRRSSRIYASTAMAAATTANAAATNFSGSYSESYSALSCPPPLPYYYWPVSAVAAPPPPFIPDNFNLTFPNQPLGLTLNFHDFNNLDASLFHYPLSMHTSSSSSSSTSPSVSSSTLTVATDEMIAMSEEVAAYSSGGSTTINGGGSLGGVDFGGGMQHAMDTEEMQELRSISEQHQMEWNDTLNLVTSARWFKFLKTTEIGADDEKDAAHEEDDNGYNPFDQIMEFPPWLVNANESCCLQDDCFSEDCLQDPALPCMDIGEIDGMVGEWLA